MQKNREELIHYLNGCPNCYGTIVDDVGRPEIIYIDRWYVFDNGMIIAIDDHKKEILKRAHHSKIAFAIWNKMEGYQMKGTIMASGEIKKLWDSIEDSKKDLISKGAMVIAMTDIYSVTPGKQAGENVTLLNK